MILIKIIIVEGTPEIVQNYPTALIMDIKKIVKEITTLETAH